MAVPRNTFQVFSEKCIYVARQLVQDEPNLSTEEININMRHVNFHL